MFEALKKKISETKLQASNISENIIDSIKVSEEVHNERLEICKSCDQLHKIEFCKICGCYMPAKTWLPNSSCPLKKWQSIKVIKE